MRRNIVLKVDSYKASHWKQYPPGTDGMFSYIEARCKDPGRDYTVFFGLQAFIQEYLLEPFTQADIDEAVEIFAAHGEPFNQRAWEYILEQHNGLMPVRIDAVPEGTVVPNGNVLATVESTDSRFPWVASYVETALLRGVWYPTTVAQRSHASKQVIKRYLQETADDLSGLPFKLHDFGARGVSSPESAMLGGMGHLVNFMGTDTVEALVGMRRYYGEKMAGFSIPAAEHSTITSWGKDREVDAYRNMVQQFAGEGKVYAVVSDSYDLENAVANLWGGELKDLVIAHGGTLVIRPDSGDPVANVTKVCQLLDNKFGSTVNSKGYKVLNHVRVIQGDGIDGPHVIENILSFLKMNGFSADNVAFGMGGGLLQHVNRDTLGFAMKCSAIRVNGMWRDVKKEAPGKVSKTGHLYLMKSKGGYFTQVGPRNWREDAVCMMRTVYCNGLQFGKQSLADIRRRAEEGL